MKKITAFLLLTALVLSAVACASTTDTSNSANTSDSVSSKPEPEPTDLKIDKNCAVVLPVSATKSEIAAADSIIAALEKHGITLQKYDDSADAASNEILVGKTARTASQNALNGLTDGDFAIVVNTNEFGNSIALAANDPDGIALCTDYFIYSYLQKESDLTLPLDLNFNHKRSNKQINGINVSDYTIVYAKEGVNSDKNIQAAKYQDTVTEFVTYLKKATGVTLNAIPDTENLTSFEHLILFGNTARPEDNILYNPKFIASGAKAYTVKLLNNGNLALAGTNAISTLAAGKAAVLAMLGEKQETNDLNCSGKADLIHVACIGDSITYGTNSTDPSMQSYPVYLQRMLGYSYYVEKYGAPSHSLIETDTQSFLKHEYFKKSTAAKPDVVIVMLGTNDCRTQKWEDSAYKNWADPARKQAFLSSGKKLIDAYRAANKEVQIIFATCPTVPQDAWLGTDWTSRIRKYGNPTIRSLAESNDCPVIDVFTFSTKHPEMFEGGDGLHPQNEQYQILAQGIYDLCRDIIKQ